MAYGRLLSILVVLTLLTGCAGYNEMGRSLANSSYDAQGRPDLKQPAPRKGR